MANNTNQSNVATTVGGDPPGQTLQLMGSLLHTEHEHVPTNFCSLVNNAFDDYSSDEEPYHGESLPDGFFEDISLP